MLIPIPTPRPERANRGSSTSSMYLAQTFFLSKIVNVFTNLSSNRKWLFTSQNYCRSGRQQGWGMALRKKYFSTTKKWLNSPSSRGLCGIFSLSENLSWESFPRAPKACLHQSSPEHEKELVLSDPKARANYLLWLGGGNVFCLCTWNEPEAIIRVGLDFIMDMEEKRPC